MIRGAPIWAFTNVSITDISVTKTTETDIFIVKVKLMHLLNAYRVHSQLRGTKFSRIAEKSYICDYIFADNSTFLQK